MPAEVMEVRVVLGLCDRFHVLPSELLAEDCYLLRLLLIEKLAEREGG
jgi:hypothetical protein